MLKILLLSSALVTASVVVYFRYNRPSKFNAEWEEFKVTFKKVYDPLEEIYRRAIFEQKAAAMKKHNLEAERGDHTYKIGINQFSDRTYEEMATLFKGFVAPNLTSEFALPGIALSLLSDNLPDSVDWRSRGYVTPVKEQGDCGSCWAFSATGALEGQHFKKTGMLVSLSEMNLVDCSKDSDGCNGGNPMEAFTYVMENNGIATEASYPYEPTDGPCRFNPDNVGATATGYQLLPQDEDQLLQAVATVGPISVAIHVTNDTFPYYDTGIYYEPHCNQYDVNHAMLIVGYGTDNAIKYWLLKNSWGERWGEDGYIRMARGRNICGITKEPSYPFV